MARARTTFVCNDCGHEAHAWSGQCKGCGEWNTLAEVRTEPTPAKGATRGRAGSAARAGSAGRPVPLRDVTQPPEVRLLTGIGELDRVLGGGLVPGSLILLGGAPGIGKSTITAMALGNLAGSGRRTLYVTGEESAAQVRMRAERLGDGALAVPALAETELERGAGDDRGGGARGLRRRLDPDDALGRVHERPGLRRAGARGRRRADGGREADRHGA